ncbi:unnamed protein product [Absidia cylindrospora]
MSQINLFFTLVFMAMLAIFVQADPVCNGQQDYLPDPNDCSMYYRCINNSPIAFQCPTNLHWDAKDNLCQYAETACCFGQC